MHRQLLLKSISESLLQFPFTTDEGRLYWGWSPSYSNIGAGCFCSASYCQTDAAAGPNNYVATGPAHNNHPVAVQTVSTPLSSTGYSSSRLQGRMNGKGTLD